MTTSYKNKTFPLFSKIQSKRWDFYNSSQKEIQEGVVLTKETGPYLHQLIIEIHNHHQRSLPSGQFKFKEEDGKNTPFIFVYNGPILRHTAKVLFFLDETWVIECRGKEPKTFSGNMKSLSDHTDAILEAIDKTSTDPEGSFFIKATPKTFRLNYERDLRNVLTERRKDYLRYLQEDIWKETFYDALKEDLPAMFKVFGLDLEDPSWKQKLHGLAFEDLSDLHDSLAVKKSGMKTEDYLTQHVQREWTQKIEDIWKKATQKS